MHKYRIKARYYHAKIGTFTNDYEYYIETEDIIKAGDYIAILDNSVADVRCVLVTEAYKLRKENTVIRRKVLIGVVKTTFFHDMVIKQREQELLELLEKRAKQVSKMQLYETLADSDPEIAALLKELKEIEK